MHFGRTHCFIRILRFFAIEHTSRRWAYRGLLGLSPPAAVTVPDDAFSGG